MKAIKENREYTITETDVTSFKNEGYDIYDDNGKLVAYGTGKTVSFEQYAKTVEQLESANDEIVSLNDQIESLNGEIEKLTAKLKAKKGKKE